MNKTNRNKDAFDKLNNVFLNILLNHIAKGFSQNWLNSVNGNIISINATSGKIYSWLNQLILDYKCLIENRNSKNWLTLQQGIRIGARLNSGFERPAFSCYFSFKHYEYETGRDISGIVKAWLKMGIPLKDISYVNSPYIEIFDLFNSCQFDNLPESYNHPGLKKEFTQEDKLNAVDTFIVGCGVDLLINENNDRLDLDTLAGKLYILSRWSLKMSTLSSLSIKNVPDKLSQALFTELFSAFLCAHIGFSYPISIDPVLIKDWIDSIKASPYFFVKVIAFARKSVEYSLNNYCKNYKSILFQKLVIINNSDMKINEFSNYTLACDVPMYKHYLDKNHFVFLSKNCQLLVKKGYYWVFDIITASQILPKTKSHESLNFIVQLRPDDNIPIVTCKSTLGFVLFKNIAPGKVIDHALYFNLNMEEKRVRMHY